ncbi:hypothetical protein [Emcibacter nanhaiensis]|uniref:Surface antigen domain-containing protein n=1 Tax=Emcibacter nanhaiensis TaxID=1505037 RepID=A0A501PQ91_9PROT|nr:hypothetical protein [Emcibacter nanhaiensis]TPD62613.1 hypothetical protein FIV46_00590 [Emcibacter nanhaiensis]
MSKITRFLKTSTVILGVASFGFVTTTQAWADGRRDDRRHQENRHDRSHKYEKHHKYNKHYKYKQYTYYRPHHYDHVRYSYRPHRPRAHFGVHGHGDDVALGILAGGLLVYGLTQAAQANNQPDVVYVPAAQPSPAGGQGWAAAPPPQQVSYSHGTCLQEREYQTTITVGNETVPAYGTACLQPDGSWQFGPAKQVPQYAR